jgi:hypothetical protein
VSAGFQNLIVAHESVTPSAEPPSLTWTSRAQNESIPVNNGSTLVGDHVVLNATFPEELNVTRCEMKVWSGFTYTITRPLVIPSKYPGGAFSGLINHTEFDWVTITGIEKGLHVNVTCNFTVSDVDFMGWDGTQDPSEYAYDNNIVNMASGDKPENDVFFWESDSDTLILGCLNYCREIGNWTLYLKVGAEVITQSDSSTIIQDTYDLGAFNQTCSVNVTGYTETNATYTLMREEVHICNFFVPKVTVSVEPLLADERTFNISWSTYDLNSDDVHLYWLWASDKYGYSYMLLAYNITDTWCSWNSSGWLENEYIVRVRAYSIDLTVLGKNELSNPPYGYYPGDYGDGFSATLSAGDVTGGVIYDPNMDVGVYPASEVTYNEGETGHSIDWEFYVYNWGFSPSMIHYQIYRNQTLIIEDIHYFSTEQMVLSIDVDGLSEGTYNYTLRFVNPGSEGGLVQSSVFVIVNPSLSNSTPITNTTLVDPFVSTLLLTTLVISIPVIALIAFTILVRKGFDRDIIKRNN